MSKWRLTKEQIEKKLKGLRKRLKQLETLQEKGQVYWCHIEAENYNPQAKRWFFEKRAIEYKIFDFEERLRNGQYKKPPEV